MSFSKGEIAIFVNTGGPDHCEPEFFDFFRLRDGMECEIAGEYVDDGQLIYQVIFRDGADADIEACFLRHRPHPNQSQSDREAKERHLKGCRESFDDMLKVIGSEEPLEETMKRVQANMEKYSGS